MKKDDKNKEFYSKYFLIISIIAITSLLISNITAVKLFSIGNIVLPASAMLFQLTF